MDRGMNRTLEKRRMPLMLLLSAVAAITLGFGAFFWGGGTASAQTPAGGSPTASATTSTGSPTASPSATSTTASASPSASASAAPSAPSTGSGVASTSNSSELPIVLGGLAAVAGGAALFGVSLKKRN